MVVCIILLVIEVSLSEKLHRKINSENQDIIKFFDEIRIKQDEMFNKMAYHEVNRCAVSLNQSEEKN